MLNHHRGLWGYSGEARDGQPLSVQSTGMGGPSTAIVIEELIALGARSFVRIGTCGALDPALSLGDLVVASQALAEDGASTALGATGPIAADRRLTAALAEAAAAPERTVASVDLFYQERSPGSATRHESPATAVEMEAATLFRLAQLRHARAACLLAVTDVLEGGAARRAGRLGPKEIEAVGLRLGEAALSALIADTR